MGLFNEEEDDEKLADALPELSPEEKASLLKSYGPSINMKDDAGIKEASANAAHDNMMTGIFEGLSTAFAGANKTDPGFYAGLRSQAQNRIKGAEDAFKKKQDVAQYIIANDSKLKARQEALVQQAKMKQEAMDQQDTRDKAKQEFTAAENAKDRSVKLKTAEDANSLRQQLMEAKLGGEAPLPLDQKKEVETLAIKNANKRSIANQIKSGIAEWDAAKDDDQKLTTGLQLIKVLNSTEGADAVGKEEAERLAGYLKYKVGNITGPGSFMGRDLPEFRTQMESKAREIENAIAMNQGNIDSLYGRSNRTQPNLPPPAPAKGTAAAAAKPAVTPSDLKALDWLKNNPKDPNAPSVRDKLKRKGVL